MLLVSSTSCGLGMIQIHIKLFYFSLSSSHFWFHLNDYIMLQKFQTWGTCGKKMSTWLKIILDSQPVVMLNISVEICGKTWGLTWNLFFPFSCEKGMSLLKIYRKKEGGVGEEVFMQTSKQTERLWKHEVQNTASV